MLKQRSALSYNNSNNYTLPTQPLFLNNKENNPNIDNEDYPIGSVLQSNNTNVLGPKLLQNNHNISNLQPLSSKAGKNFIVSEDSDNSIKDPQSHLIAQQLIKDVRALAIQNQKTEQNLRELQQKINLQKGKQRVSLINPVENKENQETVFARQQTRNHSYSIQPLSNDQGTTATSQNSYQSFQDTTTSINHRIRFSNNMPSTSTNANNEARGLSREQRSKPPTKIEAPVKQQQLLQQQNSLKTVSSETKSNNLEKKDGLKTPIEKEETLSQRFGRILINENYSLDIINYLKSQEFTTVPKNCLLKHNIPQGLRAKMVDWMVEVMKSYKCSEETFFMAVRIMDHFLEKSKIVKEVNELHLIGVTCIFIACKFEEIYPMRLSILQERIAHNKLSEQQIKSTEAEILHTLNFNLLGTSPYDIAMHALTLAGYQERFSTEEFSYGHKICVYLCKMALYDYEFNKTTTYSLLGASVIYIVFKIFQQINSQFSAEQNIKHVVNLLKIDQRELVNCSTRILHLAKNFAQIFPDLNNLQKFNGFDNKQNQTFGQ